MLFKITYIFKLIFIVYSICSMVPIIVLSVFLNIEILFSSVFILKPFVSVSRISLHWDTVEFFSFFNVPSSIGRLSPWSFEAMVFSLTFNLYLTAS